MVPKLKQKFQSETDVPDVGKVPEITLKPRDGTLSYLLLRSSSLIFTLSWFVYKITASFVLNGRIARYELSNESLFTNKVEI